MSTATNPRDELMPEWMTVALEECGRGVIEFAGIKANPRILLYFTKTGLKGTKLAQSDETAWCSAFACWVIEQHKRKSTRSAAARSWLTYGDALEFPEYGAITVLWRGSPDSAQGHVGFYAGEAQNGREIYLLGGNQKNRVCIAPYPKTQVLSYRWPSDESARYQLTHRVVSA